MKKNTKLDVVTSYEVIKSQRGDWGQIKPVTKVIPHKKQEKQRAARIKEALADAGCMILFCCIFALFFVTTIDF